MGVAEEPHGGVELDAVFGGFVVWVFDFEDDLFGLLGEKVEEDGFAEALVAELFVDGEMLDVDKPGEGPVGEDSDGLVAIVIGGDHKMEFRFVAIL